MNTCGALLWPWATVLAFTPGNLLAHLRSGRSQTTGRGTMQQGRSPAQLGAPADAQDMGVSPGSLQSPLPPASPPASDRAVAACTSRAPRSPARPRLHSAAGGSRCFHYTLSRRREGVKLLFLFLQCKICQLGTVDRLPLCHCSGSFNCLPCVRATVCVCTRVPCKGLVCSLARSLAQKRS